MFGFSHARVGGFDVYRSYQKQGDEHRKRFVASGSSPQSQATWNLYIAGSFEFTVGAFSQTLSAGQTSLALTLPEFPKDEVCVERVLSPLGVRYCVSAKTPWGREVIALPAAAEHQTTRGGTLFVLSGAVGVNGISCGPGACVVVPRDAVIAAQQASVVAIATA